MQAESHETHSRIFAIPLNRMIGIDRSNSGSRKGVQVRNRNLLDGRKAPDNFHTFDAEEELDVWKIVRDQRGRRPTKHDIIVKLGNAGAATALSIRTKTAMRRIGSPVDRTIRLRSTSADCPATQATITKRFAGRTITAKPATKPPTIAASRNVRERNLRSDQSQQDPISMIVMRVRHSDSVSAAYPRTKTFRQNARNSQRPNCREMRQISLRSSHAARRYNPHWNSAASRLRGNRCEFLQRR